MNAVLSVKNINQRRFKFKTLYNEIIKSFKNIVGFYAGCLLWATYIKYSNAEENKEIDGNNFLNQDINDTDKFDFLYEIDYLINYFEKFEKDTKFFLGKSETLPKKWKFIGETYKNFLIINNNFTQTKTTEDLKLPDSLTKPDEKALETYYKCIMSIIVNGELERFIDIF